MPVVKEWYTIAEAADYLGVSRRTIYKLTESGRLATFRIAEKRHRRFRRKDLDKVPQRVVAARATKTEALTAASDPVLADLWNNQEDAAYDRI